MEKPRQRYWEFPRFAIHAEWVLQRRTVEWILRRLIGSLLARRIAVWFPEIAIARIFEEPIGQIEAGTGQPWKAWTWCCVVIVQRRRLTVCGAHTAPNHSWLSGLKKAAVDLGMKRLVWERWHEGRKFTLEFALP